MAEIFGDAGRYVSQEAVNKRWRLVITALIGMGTICLVCGISIGLSLHELRMPFWGSAAISTAALMVIMTIGKFIFPEMDRIEMQRVNWQKGANGEAKVADQLKRLPGAFKVVHDVSTPYGNLDHVVIGPSGVFVLDAKDWRGIVSLNEKDELLLNNKSMKSDVKKFVGRYMDVRDKIIALDPSINTFFQGVFVFTSAYVAGCRSKPGAPDYLRDDMLFSYLVEWERKQKLSPGVVMQLTNAFLQYARMGLGANKKHVPTFDTASAT